MRDLIGAIEAEYRRYRSLGEATMDQLNGGQMCTRVSEESLSIATIAWHVSGNLESRFTDFLTTDGEKPWRQRDDEFTVRTVTKDELRAKWDRGWNVLMDTLASLDDEQLSARISIRGVDFTVAEALQRSLAHTAYHVGQITFLGKMLAGDGWTYLSIAPGGTASYNANPTREKG
jgi:uncharacterized damage-inducible protein DinB